MVDTSINIEIYVKIEDEAWAAFICNVEELIHHSIYAAFEADKKDGGMVKEGGYYSVSVVLADDDMVAGLNEKWRGKKGATNVLSFALNDGEKTMPIIEGVDAPLILGDIILARETILKEAKEQSKNLENHFMHLLVHGSLHLLGYDHIDDDDAKIMGGLEVIAMKKLGKPDPYLVNLESKNDG